MARILVVYHSESGNTARLAQCVAEGARETDAEISLKPVDEAVPDDLLNCDGIIAGSPTYYGLMSAPLKRLFDESVKYHGRLAGKVGGAFTSSGVLGGGAETTVLSILQAMLVHGMIVQGSPRGPHYGAVAVGPPDESAEKCARELGWRVAALAIKLAE